MRDKLCKFMFTKILADLMTESHPEMELIYNVYTLYRVSQT